MKSFQAKYFSLIWGWFRSRKLKFFLFIWISFELPIDVTLDKKYRYDFHLSRILCYLSWIFWYIKINHSTLCKFMPKRWLMIMTFGASHKKASINGIVKINDYGTEKVYVFISLLNSFKWKYSDRTWNIWKQTTNIMILSMRRKK